MSGKRKLLKIQKIWACIIPISLLCSIGGYRRYWDGKHMVYYHRYIWEMIYGKVPEGYDLHHLCHNKGCCNLEHIQLLPKFTHLQLHKIGNKNNCGKHFNKPFKLSTKLMMEAKKYWELTHCLQYKLASHYKIGATTAHRYIVRWRTVC